MNIRNHMINGEELTLFTFEDELKMDMFVGNVMAHFPEFRHDFCACFISALVEHTASHVYDFVNHGGSMNAYFVQSAYGFHVLFSEKAHDVQASRKLIAQTILEENGEEISFNPMLFMVHTMQNFKKVLENHIDHEDPAFYDMEEGIQDHTLDRMEKNSDAFIYFLPSIRILSELPTIKGALMKGSDSHLYIQTDQFLDDYLKRYEEDHILFDHVGDIEEYK